MTVIYIVVGAAFTYAAWFYYHGQGSLNMGLRWLFYIILLVYLCTITYAFSWLSRYEMSTIHALTYPIAITLMHLRFSLGLIIFWAAATIGLYWAYNTFLFAPLLVLIPGLKCLLDTYMIEPVLKKYESIALSAAEAASESATEPTSSENIIFEDESDKDIKEKYTDDENKTDNENI